mmetsp:Transcript_41070/g.128006  ORF Transcript_41070/g.128006 Transcript_41070/m.128006 type:complete len:427 (-) Transcript_41070:293-1573(-)
MERLVGLHEELPGRPQAAHARGPRDGGQRGSPLRRRAGGARRLQLRPLLRGPGLRNQCLGYLECLRPRRPALALADGAAAPGWGEDLRGRPPRDPGVQPRDGLRALSVERVGRVRQDVRGRPAGEAAPGRPEPHPGGRAVPAEPHGDARLQRGAVRREGGLRRERVGALERVQCVLRCRPAPARAEDHAAPEEWRHRVRPRAHAVGRLLRGPLRVCGLPLERLGRLERLLLFLRRRPAHAHPPRGAAAAARGQALRAAEQGGGRRLQRRGLRHRRMRGRRLGRVGGVVGVLQELQGRRRVALALRAHGGEPLRQACHGPHAGLRELQRGRALRAVCGLRLRGVAGLERLQRHLQRREAALQGHRRARQGRGQVLPGVDEGDFALQPRAGGADARGLPGPPTYGLPARSVGRLELVQRQLRWRFAHA